MTDPQQHKNETIRDIIQRTRPKYMTLAQFADALGIHNDTAYRWAKSGKLRIRQVGAGKKIFVAVDELDDTDTTCN